jgi:hypothetical protein
VTRLQDLIGVESELSRVSNALRQFAQELGAPVVGGYQVTCSDEAERECTEAFQHWFAREVLPCVTINRVAEPNTELVIGQYGIDRTEQTPAIKHRGLGDDPAGYRVRHEQGRVVIEDDQWPDARA